MSVPGRARVHTRHRYHLQLTQGRPWPFRRRPASTGTARYGGGSRLFQLGSDPRRVMWSHRARASVRGVHSASQRETALQERGAGQEQNLWLPLALSGPSRPRFPLATSGGHRSHVPSGHLSEAGPRRVPARPQGLSPMPKFDLFFFPLGKPLNASLSSPELPFGEVSEDGMENPSSSPLAAVSLICYIWLPGMGLAQFLSPRASASTASPMW